jgi:hypothetical protein
MRGNPPVVRAIEKRMQGVQCLSPECTLGRSPERPELGDETPSVPLIAKAGHSYNFEQRRTCGKRGR